MSRRSRKISAADVPDEVAVPDPRLLQEATFGAALQFSALISAPADHECATNAVMLPPGKAAPRPGSKLGIVLGLLGASEGASLTRLVEVTGWLPHTTRAALTGLRKRGYAVSSEKSQDEDGKTCSVYRLAPVTVAS